MATRSSALLERAPARPTFYVVRHHASPVLPGMVTVAHAVPAGADQLASFDNPNRALDFAEAMVDDLRRKGSEVEMVDPPHGIVGAG